MENNINTGVYKPKPVTVKYFPGEKGPGLEPDIQL